MLTLLRRLLPVGSDAKPEGNFFITSGLEFYGDLVARASSGRIEGKFDGHIIECKKLIIGPHAAIKGNIFAEEIVVYGYCEGNIYAAGDIKVLDTAVVLGDIYASSLIIEQNATFHGNLRKLRTEDFLDITAREKDRIIQQRKSNVYNIHSRNAKLEAEQRKAQKVANGLPLTSETEVRPNTRLKRVKTEMPIVIPQNSIMPASMTTGAEMPRTSNALATPDDAISLKSGSTDFMEYSMRDSSQPDHADPMSNAEHETVAQKPKKKLRLKHAKANNVEGESSASMLIDTSDSGEKPELVEIIGEAVAGSEPGFPVVKEIPEETSADATAIVTTEVPADAIIDVEEASGFIEADAADALAEDRLEADQLYMNAGEVEVEKSEPVADAAEFESGGSITRDEALDEPLKPIFESEASVSEVIEEAAVNVQNGSANSSPTTGDMSLDSFPMTPGQLNSTEAHELHEASDNMIVIREEQVNLETEELRDKSPEVPTAESGYEPGYTNQEPGTREHEPVQPENTRRWF